MGPARSLFGSDSSTRGIGFEAHAVVDVATCTESVNRSSEHIEFTMPIWTAILAAAFAYGFSHTLAKRLSSTHSPMAILFYTTASQLPLALLPALNDWAWPLLAAWPWVVGAAIVFSASQLNLRAASGQDKARRQVGTRRDS